MNAKNQPIKDAMTLATAEALVDSTKLICAEAEKKFLFALEAFKEALKAHAKAEITLVYVQINLERAN